MYYTPKVQKKRHNEIFWKIFMSAAVNINNLYISDLGLSDRQRCAMERRGRCKENLMEAKNMNFRTIHIVNTPQENFTVK